MLVRNVTAAVAVTQHDPEDGTNLHQKEWPINAVIHGIKIRFSLFPVPFQDSVTYYVYTQTMRILVCLLRMDSVRHIAWP